MEKIKIMEQGVKKSLDTMDEILNTDYSIMVRDASIQRFEYCFEITWKFLKEYLAQKEGIVCNSPKSCFKEAFRLNLISEEQTVLSLDMTDKRNLTSHTYHEGTAEDIYENLKEYYEFMMYVYNAIKSQ